MKNIFTRFKTNNRGNVAMILAIVLAPLLGFVGYSIDYNEASRQKAILQSASDMAALFIAKSDDPDKKQKANALAAEIVQRVANETTVAQLSVEGEIIDKTVTVKASGNAPNSFSRIFGFEFIRVSVMAQTTYNVPKIEVGLVLDNSGSMKNNNDEGILALRKSTFELISLFETLKDEGESTVKAAFNTFDHRTLLSEGLSTDWQHLKQNAQQRMNPIGQGYTNIGKSMRESHEHLKKGDKHVKKFMIVLTDGDEKQAPNYPSEQHLWMPETCPKVREDKDVTIYTIGLGSDLKPQALIDCAGSEKRFFHVKDYSKLTDTFKQIFDEISALRLTK